MRLSTRIHGDVEREPDKLMNGKHEDRVQRRVLEDFPVVDLFTRFFFRNTQLRASLRDMATSNVRNQLNEVEIQDFLLSISFK